MLSLPGATKQNKAARCRTSTSLGTLPGELSRQQNPVPRMAGGRRGGDLDLRRQTYDHLILSLVHPRASGAQHPPIVGAPRNQANASRTTSPTLTESVNAQLPHQ